MVWISKRVQSVRSRVSQVLAGIGHDLSACYLTLPIFVNKTEHSETIRTRTSSTTSLLYGRTVPSKTPIVLPLKLLRSGRYGGLQRTIYSLVHRQSLLRHAYSACSVMTTTAVVAQHETVRENVEHDGRPRAIYHQLMPFSLSEFRPLLSYFLSTLGPHSHSPCKPTP